MIMGQWLRQHAALGLLLIFLTGCGAAASTPAVLNQSPTEIGQATTDSPLANVAAAPTMVAVAEPITAPAVTGELAPAAATGDDGLALQSMLVDLYRAANSAVVYIVVPNLGSGSGFVYSDDGVIVTNHHVVTGGRQFEIVFANGQRQPAELLGADADSDLAALKVAELPAGVAPLPLADPDELAVGQFVAAIGSPFGEQGSMSLGIISGLGRSLPSQRSAIGNTYSLPQVIQTDAPINPGNSGGPLLNLAGEVVGVNAAIATSSGSNSGVGFSIPVSAVRQIVPSLITDGRHAYPYLGAGFDDEITLAEQAVYGLDRSDGTYVLSVTPGGPAATAGLRAANSTTGRGGDLVIAIDGRSVRNFDDLNSYLVFEGMVGQTVELTVVRDGQTVVLPLTLGQRP